MLRKIGAEAKLSNDRNVILGAGKLVLPGVGSFDTGMKNLAQLGLIPLLNEVVIGKRTPILGICLGMQLLGKSSGEGALPGLGWIDFRNERFTFGENTPGSDTAGGHRGALKIPHMGWNNIIIRRDSALFAGLTEDSRFYFVHSYHAVCEKSENVQAETNYGYDFASIVGQENIYGVQFHPEKSHKFGMRLLKNFAEL